MVWLEKNYSASQTVRPTDLSEIMRKFFAKGKTEKGQALIYLKCIDWDKSGNSSPSNLCLTQPKHKRHFARQRILACQQHVWSEGQAIYKRKRCETRAQIIYSVRRQEEIGSIPHKRSEHGKRLESCREVSWVYLVSVVISLCSRRGRAEWQELTRQLFDIWDDCYESFFFFFF